MGRRPAHAGCGDSRVGKTMTIKLVMIAAIYGVMLLAPHLAALVRVGRDRREAA
jgi:hypothetical protein